MQLPLNVSSVSTSFIGLTRLGIHLVLFLACGSRCLSHSCADRHAFARGALPLLLSLFALGKIEVINCVCSVVQVHVGHEQTRAN